MTSLVGARIALTSVLLLVRAAPAFAHPGVGIVMDSRGNVYYTDLANVWRIAPDGSTSIAVPNVHTHELYIDANDNLYGEHLWYEGEATDKWGHRVWRRSGDGAVTDVIPAREGFLSDYSFVRDRTGNMYWARRDSTTVIRKRTPGGKIENLSRGTPAGPFRDVRWMISSPDGVLFLIDDGDLRRVDRDGAAHTLARQVASRSITQFHVGDRHAIMGLWLDAARNVYMAVYSGRVVKRLAHDGTISIVARSRAPWSPTGGLVAPNGDLWLLEYSITNAVRVRRLSRGGQQTIFRGRSE